MKILIRALAGLPTVFARSARVNSFSRFSVLSLINPWSSGKASRYQ